MYTSAVQAKETSKVIEDIYHFLLSSKVTAPVSSSPLQQNMCFCTPLHTPLHPSAPLYTHTHTHTERERETETERQRQRERDRDRERQRDRETERERERETETETEREREMDLLWISQTFLS